MPHVGTRLSSMLLLFGLALVEAPAAEYTLMPSPQTVHVGYFSAELKPVLTINSGDIVTIESVAGLDPAIVDASGAIPPRAAFGGMTGVISRSARPSMSASAS
jgi:hypothetical protein